MHEAASPSSRKPGPPHSRARNSDASQAHTRSSVPIPRSAPRGAAPCRSPRGRSRAASDRDGSSSSRRRRRHRPGAESATAAPTTPSRPRRSRPACATDPGTFHPDSECHAPMNACVRNPVDGHGIPAARSRRRDPTRPARSGTAPTRSAGPQAGSRSRLARLERLRREVAGGCAGRRCLADLPHRVSPAAVRRRRSNTGRRT